MAFEDFKKRYAPLEEELIILRHEGGGGAKHGDFWVASAYFLAYIDEKTGILHKGNGRLVWPITEKEEKAGGCFNRFANETIYRVKARALLDKTIRQGMAESFFNQFYVTEILEKDAESPVLSELLAEYKKPVIVQDDLLGKLMLNKQFSSFEGAIKWQGRLVSLSLDVDTGGEGSWVETINAAKQMLTEQDRWSKEMGDFAAKKLSPLANEWQADENETKPLITEQDFAKRIRLIELVMDAEGSFIAYHNDDDMFWGHSVTVYGNLESGIKSAQMEG